MNPVKKSWLQENFAEAIGNRRNITQHYTGEGGIRTVIIRTLYYVALPLLN